MIKNVFWCAACGKLKVVARKVAKCSKCKSPMRQTGFIEEVKQN